MWHFEVRHTKMKYQLCQVLAWKALGELLHFSKPWFFIYKTENKNTLHNKTAMRIKWTKVYKAPSSVYGRE